MNGQISFFELGAVDPPEIGDCFRSCVRFGTSGMDDYYPGTRIRRCMYGITQDGTTGNDVYMKTDKANAVHFFCRYYKPKEEDT